MELKSGKILIKDRITPPINFVAQELILFYERCVGEKLSITTDANDSEIIFSLGKTALLEKANFNIDYPSLKEDGFFIKEKGGVVYIDGNTKFGVMYGTYDFLEEYLGIRFFSADTTVIPKLKKIERVIDKVDVPVVDYRAYMSGDCFSWRAMPEFMARSRTYNPFTHYGETFGARDWMYGRNQSTHNMNYYIPYEKYYKDHPEFFYQRAGVKEVMDWNDDGTGNSPNLTVCLSNGITEDGKLDESMEISVAKVVIEEMKKDILAHPETKYFTFEQEDLSYGCECPKCLEQTKKYMRSGMMIRFCNLLATELQKWSDAELGGREINIVTFAYSYTKNAPVKEEGGKRVPIDQTVVPVDNVVVRLAIFGNGHYPLFSEKQSKETYQLLHDWFEIGKKFMFWGYDIGFDCILWYWPTYKNLQRDVKDLVSRNMIYIQYENETDENWQSAFRGYLFNKLLWNPDMDVEKHAKEFMTAYFGKIGGKAVFDFMDVYEEYYKKAVPEKDIVFIMLKNYREPENLDISVIDKSLAIIDNAIKATEELPDYPEKAKHLKHLTNVRCTPLFCKFKGFEYYYPNATKEEQRQCGREFIATCRKCNAPGYHAQSHLFSYEKLEQDDYVLPY